VEHSIEPLSRVEFLPALIATVDGKYFSSGRATHFTRCEGRAVIVGPYRFRRGQLGMDSPWALWRRTVDFFRTDTTDFVAAAAAAAVLERQFWAFAEQRLV